MPLDLRRLATRGAPRCAVHGQSCPTGGGVFSRKLYDHLAAEVWPLVEAPVPAWEAWTAEQSARCRPVTAAEHRDREGARTAVAEATERAATAARNWLAHERVA